MTLEEIEEALLRGRAVNIDSGDGGSIVLGTLSMADGSQRSSLTASDHRPSTTL